MGTPLEHILEELGDVPPMPAVAQRVMALTNSEHTSAQELSRVVSTDQGLAARLLKMANSSLYGGIKGVETVNQAVVRLGFQTTERIVIQASVKELFRPVDELDTWLWEHSVQTAIASHVVARATRTTMADEALTAGLLHDIGKTVMKLRHPARYRVTAEEGRTTGRWAQPEWDTYGYDHTEVGALVLAHWNLSRRLALVAQYHHATEFLDTSDVGRARREVAGLDTGAARLLAVVHLADDLTHRLSGAPWTEKDLLPPHETRAARFLGLQADQVDGLVAAIVENQASEAPSFA